MAPSSSRRGGGTDGDISKLTSRFEKAIYPWYQATVISSVASTPLRGTINNTWWKGQDDLAINAVKEQLKIYEKGLKDAEKRSKAAEGSLADPFVAKILQSIDGPSPEAAIASLIDAPPRTSMWKHDCIPYIAICIARSHMSGADGEDDGQPRKRARRDSTDNLTSDIDEWVLRNERWLRDYRSDWKYGLISFSKHSSLIFPDSVADAQARKIPRHTVSGFKFLDDKRALSISVQPSFQKFVSAFNVLSDGLLQGLDWKNVIVAGGIVLGSLLCIDPQAGKGEFKHSDIDLYIYGLSPRQANEKIRHIYDVWKSNLPKGAPSGLLRNSRTITFFSRYPIKRLQIVLKAVKDPKEVLLNFDLDIASMAWDGHELWLLPRAARAIETGYNVFTMNLILGHYLGERRATQEERLFKYADKGYGVRILPSYVESLDLYKGQEEKIGRGEPLQELEMDRIVQQASEWIDKYLDNEEPLEEDKDRPPKVSHKDITILKHKSSDPQRRSCLTGFEQLMRHVELWKRGLSGRVKLINDSFASVHYEEGVDAPLGYDDIPETLRWGPDFSMERLQESVSNANDRERGWFDEGLSDQFFDVPIEGAVEKKVESIRRVSFASSIDKILGPQCDSIIPVLVPKGGKIVPFLNDLLQAAFKKHELVPSKGDASPPISLLIEKTKKRSSKTRNRSEDGSEGEGDDEDGDEGEEDDDNEDDDEEDHDEDDDDYHDEGCTIPLEFAIWRVTSLSCWQQVDRRIDEVYEILWSFHFGNATLATEDDERLRRFITNLSKRAIREKPEDEFEAFTRWIGRKVLHADESTEKWHWDIIE